MAAPRVALLCLLLGPFHLPAQPRSSKLLTFDFAALDRRGNLVSDLKPEDFRVSDAGRPQKIIYFRRGLDVAPPAAVLTREYSNRGYGTFPHATVVLLDQLNARVELTGAEWRAVARALERAEWERDAYFYVLMKNGTLYAIRALPDSWIESAARPRFRPGEVLALFDDLRKQYRSRPAPEDGVKHSTQMWTQTAIQELATRLASVPGTRNIVWVGPHQNGKPAPPVVADPTMQIRQSTGELLEPVPIYYVAPAASINGKEDPRRPPPENPRVQETVALAIADTQRGYRIGYDPGPGNWDGRRHDVRIGCVRPGIAVRAKADYRAVRSVDIDDDRRQIIPDLVAACPFDASTIRFRAARPDGPSTRFDLRVSAGDVFFQPSGNAYACSLAVQAIHYTDEGETEVRQDAKAVDLNLTPAEREAAMRDGIHIPLDVPAVRSARFLRIVVFDRTTGSFGTLTIPSGSAQ